LRLMVLDRDLHPVRPPLLVRLKIGRAAQEALTSKERSKPITLDGILLMALYEHEMRHRRPALAQPTVTRAQIPRDAQAQAT
jgi:hypothetical protein